MRYQASNVSGRQQTLQGPLTHHFATCECLWNGQTWLDMNETPSQSMETPAGRIFALLALALGALRTHSFFFLLFVLWRLTRSMRGPAVPFSAHFQDPVSRTTSAPSAASAGQEASGAVFVLH